VITRNASTYTDRQRRDVMKLNDTLIGKLHTQVWRSSINPTARA